jgi:hypothetical protein
MHFPLPLACIESTEVARLQGVIRSLRAELDAARQVWSATPDAS